MDRDDEMLKKNIWEYIEPYLADRVGRTCIQSTEYREAAKKVDLILESLDNSLCEEQAEILEQYLCADNEANAIMESLIYRQGMKDMLVLLISILNGGKGNDSKEERKEW